MNHLMTSSYLIICILVSLSSAFPGRRFHFDTLQQKKAYCTSLALKMVTSDLTLPDARSNFRQASDDSSEKNELYDYDSPFAWNILGKLKEVSNTNLLSTLELGEETSGYAQKVLTDFYQTREMCLVQLTENNLDRDMRGLEENDFNNRLNSMKASMIRSDQLSSSPDDGIYKRGGRLSLNPSGWRKRRGIISDNNGGDDNDEQFLRNMRQLYEKRRRQLQFNPTGW